MTLRSGQKAIILLFIITVQLFTSSCSYLALSRRTKFTSSTEGVKLFIADNVDGPYEEITNRHNSIKLNHWHKSGYFVRQEKDGFVTNTTEVSRSSNNRLKSLDKALLITTDVFVSIFLPMHYLIGSRSSAAPQGTVRTVQTVALFTALGIGVAGWGAVIPAPSKLYPNKFELPPLVKILIKDTNQLSLLPGKLEFKLSKSGIMVRDYPTMTQFNKGYGFESRNTIENFEFLEDFKLYDAVATILDSAEYGIDSAVAKIDNSLLLNSRVRSVVFMTADNKLRCEVRTSWALETKDELQYLYDKTMNGNSGWTEFKEDELDKNGQESVIRETFLAATDESLKKFIALDTVQSILSAPVPIPLMDQEELLLTTGAAFCGSVSEVVKGVITVVTNEGHGSGCIVTPDGYIVTNAHVVEEDTTDLKAIMGDNVEKKIPLKFIRMNDAVDLALLKMDTTGLTPLKLALADQIETGSDVYAIGTPADVELGQTVTRGIVSGKRKFGGHQLVQTDVAISPGNSGGALIRPDGILIGIVTSEMKSGRIDDIGFAIPSTQIEEALKIKLTN